MLKNWTVVTQPIKQKGVGLLKYLRYLVSDDHKNHKGKTTIKPIFGNIERFYLKTVLNITKQELLTAKRKKGGRGFNSFAQSVCFSLPPDLPVEITLEQWKLISKDIVIELINFLNVSAEEMKDHLFINLHDQDNPHLNMIIGKVINGETRIELQQKSIVRVLKHAFNLSVLKRVGLDHCQYQPATKRKKRYKEDYYQQNKQIINTLSECHDHSSPSCQGSLTRGTSSQLVPTEQSKNANIKNNKRRYT
jgi:hypothetical protein